MRYKKISFCFSFFIISFLFFPPSSSSNPLWDAIKAYEEKDEERAKRLFKPFVCGVPVARPYCVKLGLITNNICAESPTNLPYKEETQGWFRVSEILRKKKDVEKKLKSEVKKGNAAAAYMLGQLAGKKEEKYKYYLKSIGFEENSSNNSAVIDPRSLFELVKTGKKIHYGEEDLIQKALSLQKSVEEKKKPIEQALYETAQTCKALKKYFLRSAAFHGCLEAQKELIKGGYSKNEREVLYWHLQTSEHNEPLFIENTACLFEDGTGTIKDLKRACAYGKRAIELSEPSNPEHVLIYFNNALRITQENPLLALEYFQIAQKLGDPDATREIGKLLLGSQEEEKQEEGKKILRELALQKDFTALEYLFPTFCSEKEYDEFIPIYMHLAEISKENNVSRIVEFVTGLILNSSVEFIEKYKVSLFNLLKQNKMDNKKLSNFACGQLLFFHNTDSKLPGNLNNAKLYFMVAEKLGSPEASYCLGRLHENEKEFDEAVAAYEKACALEHSLYGLSCNNAAALLMHKGADQKALVYLKKGYKASPQNPHLAFNLGRMHAQGRGGAQKSIDLVRQYFNEAMKEETLKGEAAFELANFLIKEDLKIKEFILVSKVKEEIEKNNEINHLLETSVKEQYLPAVLYFGQFLLDEESIESQKIGIEYIKKAVNNNISPSKSLYAFYLTLGIEGVIEKDGEQANKLIEQFNKEEKNIYLYKVENVIKYLESKKQKNLNESLKLETNESIAKVKVEILDSSENKGLKTTPQDFRREFSEEPTKIIIKDSKDNFKNKLTAKQEHNISNNPEEEISLVKKPATETNKKIRRAQEKLETLLEKKAPKWRKVKKLINNFIHITSGAIAPATGGGSGLSIKVGNISSGLHVPHGSNKNSISGGRLSSTKKLLKKTSDKVTKDK